MPFLQVAMSTKVVETTSVFKALSADVRQCHLEGTDKHEMTMLK